MLQDGQQADVAALLLGSMGHLITNDDAIQCFTAAATALRPDGLLIVELPSPEDLFDGAFILGDVWDAQLDGQEIVVTYGQDDDAFDPLSQVTRNHPLMALGNAAHSYRGSLTNLAGQSSPGCLQVVERSVRISTAAAADSPGSEAEDDLLVDTVPQRLYTYQEVELLARLTGFEVAAVHGGLDMDVSVESDDSYALVVCLRRSL